MGVHSLYTSFLKDFVQHRVVDAIRRSEVECGRTMLKGDKLATYCGEDIRGLTRGSAPRSIVRDNENSSGRGSSDSAIGST